MDQLLIVGGGLAGTLLALECHERGIEFKWLVTDQIPTASFAAYGMCNPVHLRNQVPVWRAAELFETSRNFFKKWSDTLEIEAFSPMPINHLVTNEPELVKWRQNSESTDLWKYTTGEPDHILHPLLNNEFIAEIRIREAFYLDIPVLIKKARSFFKKYIIEGEFNINKVYLSTSQLTFRDQTFQRMILADGMGGMKNSFFEYVPFNPCKGEVLKLKVDDLVINEAIHKRIVLVPLEDGMYLCGATYEWADLSSQTTQAAKEELLEQLNLILGKRYNVEIIDHYAGVRPAISDRRPVVGWHPKHSIVGILNGFGTRGLLVGPSTCKNLLNNYVNGEEILQEWDVKRFNKRFTKKSNEIMNPSVDLF